MLFTSTFFPNLCAGIESEERRTRRGASHFFGQKSNTPDFGSVCPSNAKHEQHDGKGGEKNGFIISKKKKIKWSTCWLDMVCLTLASFLLLLAGV